MKKYIVVTSINSPTPSIEKFSELVSDGWNVLVVGDLKTPNNWNYKNVEYLSVEDQKKLYPELNKKIPFNHYCRKNIGYIHAIKNGAEIIIDTDDDNFPLDSFGKKVNLEVSGLSIKNKGWFNVYEHFSSQLIWPRGLPLNEIHSSCETGEEKISECHIQQFLANKDPDVDAIFRLLYTGEYSFDEKKPIILNEDAWTPLNSQNTVFYTKCFPLLYLPCHVSFRMTDIWRSFFIMAMRKLHRFNISFMNATVDQFRNEHDLMIDFEDEIPGYLHNTKIKLLLLEAIKEIETPISMVNTTKAFIKKMIDHNLMIETELEIYESWSEEINKCI